ncbi:sensor histidine kinase [Candidatus Chloroploca asiatica]|uniref:histidine kinase n=1 Tax=Candidatus Chloroploca asiatica TaxID=1506545 RepID=A0A2H3KFQ0_9CHLR|nr:ATP-binding protein [Candidatus Chloroploca asiatica]PDV96513.1 hypothetical protein A9Q02_20695 [Candidatus Chloroploca asiatica]
MTIHARLRRSGTVLRHALGTRPRVWHGRRRGASHPRSAAAQHLFALGEAHGRQAMLDELRLLAHSHLKPQVLTVQHCLILARAATSDDERTHWLGEGLRQTKRLLDMVVMLPHPAGAALVPDDLEQAVTALTRNLAGTYPHCTCQVEVTGTRPPCLDDAQQRALIVIVYNALINAYLHGRPTQVTVALQYAPDALILVVCDDGCGMDLAAPAPGGRGLRDIRMLVARYDGTMQLTSAPGAGTQLRVTIPIVAPDADAGQPRLRPAHPSPERTLP